MNDSRLNQSGALLDEAREKVEALMSEVPKSQDIDHARLRAAYTDIGRAINQITILMETPGPA